MFLLLKIFAIIFPVPEAIKKRITHFLWFSLWKRKNATVVGTSKWGSELQYEERLQKWWMSTTFWWRFNTNRWLELDFCQFKNVSKSELRCIFVEMIFDAQGGEWGPERCIFGVDFRYFLKKRLAWIRTHARLRPSVYGHEAVVVTTPPRPRLRVKGVRIECMWNRTITAGLVRTQAGRLAGPVVGF